MSVLVTAIAIGALLVLLALTAVLGASATSIALLSRESVNALTVAERKGDADLSRLMERPGRVLAARALITGVSYAASAAFLTWAIEETYTELPMWLSVIFAFVVATAVLFIFGESMPRAFAIRSPERVGAATAPTARLLTGFVYPFARALSALWTWVATVATGRSGPGAPWVTFVEFEALREAESPADEGLAASRERLIESVHHFTQRIVREVMVPRTDMRCLGDDATAAEALELIRDAGYSRLPVFHENLDDIRGVLYARDLLLALGDGLEPDMRIARLVRPAYFVPETKPVHELLVQMRRTAHMALVADEYGGTAGLVTIEDLLEEIVGEIFDEYDRQVPLVVDLGAGRYRVDARLPIDELNELYGTTIERETDSVGGLFIEEAGHIPETGEAVEVSGLRLVVTELEGNRILQLNVESTGKAGLEEGPHEGDHSG